MHLAELLGMAAELPVEHPEQRAMRPTAPDPARTAATLAAAAGLAAVVAVARWVRRRG